jgi:hypothetical protein
MTAGSWGGVGASPGESVDLEWEIAQAAAEEIARHYKLHP